jgi:N-acetylmuramoyl-L-alanine amidase
MKIEEKYLTINQFSRPGRPLAAVKGVVIHWIGNPKTTAAGNRNYFENLKLQAPGENNPRYASVHFIIGLEGEAVQCLLENEMGYHVGANEYTDRALQELSSYPNNCTIGIELCHVNWKGEFTEATLNSARELILELCERYKLGRDNIYRHFDITGKNCPKWFVDESQRWIDFLDFVFSKS